MSLRVRQKFVEALSVLIKFRRAANAENTHQWLMAERQAIEAFADLRCDGHLNEAYASDDKDYREQEERHNHANCRAFLLRDCGVEVSDDERG